MNVTVVGGGLAGMVAALRLAERGCRVVIYEASDRLGGKAGAKLQGSQADEHGYHIFPMWYLNAQKLAQELGVTASFEDHTDFKQLSAQQYPRYTSFTNITSARFALKNIFAGVLSPPEAFLFIYAALDLMSQPYRYREQLDQITITGFLRSRFYRTDGIAQQFEELMLKGISVPTYEVSAMTMRNVMRYWVRYPEPMMRILKGNLQTLWIGPLQRRLEELGCHFFFEHRLDHFSFSDSRLSMLHFETPHGSEDVQVDSAVIAIPAEKLSELIGDDAYAIAPTLAQVKYIRTRSMAALDVEFKRRLAGIPRDHVNLVGSRFGLSFIDVSQVWPGSAGTFLNIIASDFTALIGLSEASVIQQLLSELRRYIPDWVDADIRQVTLQAHREQPLFMNNVGGWAYRPDAATQIPNMFLAGDFCRSAIDLVCMEGAICSGLLAAEALRKNAGLVPPVDILVPDTYPNWLIWMGKVLLMPAAGLAKIITLFRWQTRLPSGLIPEPSVPRELRRVVR